MVKIIKCAREAGKTATGDSMYAALRSRPQPEDPTMDIPQQVQDDRRPEGVNPDFHLTPEGQALFTKRLDRVRAAAAAIDRDPHSWHAHVELNDAVNAFHAAYLS